MLDFALSGTDRDPGLSIICFRLRTAAVLCLPLLFWPSRCPRDGLPSWMPSGFSRILPLLWDQRMNSFLLIAFLRSSSSSMLPKPASPRLLSCVKLFLSSVVKCPRAAVPVPVGSISGANKLGGPPCLCFRAVRRPKLRSILEVRCHICDEGPLFGSRTNGIATG